MPKKQTTTDLMKRACEAAQAGGRRVRPNPKVGAALLSTNGEIVLGYHKEYGGPHAEVNLLATCEKRGISPKGAKVAVTLEPCCHHGKTPPCTKTLIDAGVAEIFVGTLDSSPKVSGKGVKELRLAGIHVQEGVLEQECREINRHWLWAQAHGRPFVTMKMATSLDGVWKAPQGMDRWITGEAARDKGHELRAEVDAIVSSIPTILVDDPLYTARPGGVEAADQPELLLLSRKKADEIALPAELKIHKRPGGYQTLQYKKSFKQSLKGLFEKGIMHVMIEAGPTLTHALLKEEGAVQEIWHFVAPRYLGGQELSSPSPDHFEIRSQHKLTDGNLFLVLAAQTK